jgi:PAS domain S-box-containing protein
MTDYYRELLSGKPFSVKEVYFPKTSGGTAEYFNLTGIPLFENENFSGAIISAELITDEVKNREKIKLSEERLGAALKGGNVSILELSFETNKILWYGEWSELLGYKQEELSEDFEFWKSLLHPSDFQLVLNNFENYLNSTVKQLTFEHRLRHAKGHYIWVLSSNKVTESNEDGTPKKILGVYVNITERKRAEDKEKELFESYNQIFNSSIDAIYVLDEDGQFLEVNSAAELMYGYSADEFVGKTPAFLSAPGKNDMKQVIKYLNQAYNGEKIEFDFWGLRKNGESFPKIVRLNSIIYKGKKAIVAFGLDITDRYKAEQMIKESNEKYSALVEQANEGILINQDWKIKYCNKYLIDMLGYSEEELLESSIDKYMTQEAKEESKKLFEARIQDKEVSSIYESEAISKSGKIIPIEINSKKTIFKGKPAVQSIIRDISDRKKSESLLSKTKQQLQFAIDGSGAGLWDWYTQSGKCTFSEQWANIIGYKLSELEPIDINTWLKYVHPDDLARSNTLLKEYFAGKTKTYVCEARMKHKNGNWIWVLDRGEVVEWDKNGEPYRMVGTHIEITQLKMTEEALRKSEKRYRLLVENQTDLIVEIDNQNKFTFVSPSYCRMFGKTESELLGNSFVPLLHEDDRIKTIEEMEKLKVPPFTCRLEQRVLTNFGWKWLEWNDKATVDSNNNLISIIGVGRDITDRKKAEKEIEEKEENLRATLNTSADSVLLLEKDGTIIEVNQIFTGLINTEREKIIGKNLLELIPQKRLNEVKKLLNKILDMKKPYTFIDFAFDKTWELNIRPIFDQYGDINRITIFAKDITEKYFYEEELKKTNEKLRKLSRHFNFVREEERKNISREVHDNLGQKLTALNLEISWIKQNMPENLTEVKKQFDDIMELVNQSIIVVQEISTELRPGILDDLGLSNAIQWQCNKISRKSNLNFTLDLLNEEIELSDEIKTVLFRVFQEALTNIIRHSKAKNITVNLRLEQKILIFEITDDGIGIPQEKLNDYSSFGIIGMRERIDSIKGSIEISIGKIKGTIIKISVPIEEVI